MKTKVPKKYQIEIKKMRELGLTFAEIKDITGLCIATILKYSK